MTATLGFARSSTLTSPSSVSAEAKASVAALFEQILSRNVAPVTTELRALTTPQESAFARLNNGVKLDIIINCVARAYGLTREDLLRHKREARIAWPRQIAMFFACEMTDYSLPQLAGKFAKKDHTTVMYARDKVRKLAEQSEAFREGIDSLRQSIQKTDAEIREAVSASDYHRFFNA